MEIFSEYYRDKTSNATKYDFFKGCLLSARKRRAYSGSGKLNF